MARINDMGGTEGFGPVPTAEDPEPFHADWEARVFAIQWELNDEVFNSDELRNAIERMPPEDYLRASYYERWLVGMETLLREKGLIGDA